MTIRASTIVAAFGLSGVLGGVPLGEGVVSNGVRTRGRLPPPLFYGPYPLSLRSRVQGDREIPAFAGMTSRGNCSIMKHGSFTPS